jgi:hypothetical protein
VHGVSGQPGRFRAGPAQGLDRASRYIDLVDGSEHVAEADGTIDVPLAPYGVRWLRAA